MNKKRKSLRRPKPRRLSKVAGPLKVGAPWPNPWYRAPDVVTVAAEIRVGGEPPKMVPLTVHYTC